jgi:hypothetical protein
MYGTQTLNLSLDKGNIEALDTETTIETLTFFRGVIHQDQCCRFGVCGKTFAATKGAPFYRAHKPPEEVLWVMELLAYGYPSQAIVRVG